MGQPYITRANWLRAAVLGVNDGILSTTSLIIGMAAAGSSSTAIIIAGLAALIAGATSMAAGEYVSVSSQQDVEKSDIERQQQALDEYPEKKLNELADIYRKRGLPDTLALKVSEILTQNDGVDALARDALGIHENTRPRALQASAASATAFVTGAILPLSVASIIPLSYTVSVLYGFTIVFLAVSGACAAKLGGCIVWRAVLRICFWGTLSMAFTALIGYLVEGSGIII